MHNHTPQQRQHIPLGAIIGLVIFALVPIIGIGVWLWLQWAVITDRYPFFADMLSIAIFLLPVVLISYGASIGITVVWRRLGWRESVYADKEIAMMRAQVQVAPLATNFHYELNNEPAQLIDAMPQLDVVKPRSEWLTWADEQPHILLGGKTKAGKTTTATAILAERLSRGESVFIIDPHASDWLGLPTAGSVSNAGELRNALKAILNEYLRRMQTRETHKRETGRELPQNHFPRMTVLIDEANAIAEELTSEWKTILKVIASGSRKIGISLLLLAQSALVEDLNISGSMRENFARIALDQRTVQTLIDNERNKDRKLALLDAVKAMRYPAAAQIGAEVWLLERDDLTTPNAPANATSQMWRGWDYAHGSAAQSGQSTSSAADIAPESQQSGKALCQEPPETSVLEPSAQSALEIKSRDDLIRLLVKQGLSANEIVGMVKGDSQALYARIRELKGIE